MVESPASMGGATPGIKFHGVPHAYPLVPKAPLKSLRSAEPCCTDICFPMLNGRKSSGLILNSALGSWSSRPEASLLGALIDLV